jgi:tetratricopeptide (TPR) repeat protein
MTCEEVERDELVERYVLGRLEKHEQKAFEDHYFNCSTCLERLQVVEDIRGELSVGAVRTQAGRWRRVAVGIAAAAAVVLAIRVGPEIWTGSGSVLAPVKPPLALPPAGNRPADLVPRSLGAIVLPAYKPLQLRAAPSSGERVFREGMVPYAAGNCRAAVPRLRRAVQLDASLFQARFYLAACELQAGSLEDADRQLQQVAAAGETAFLEDAHFFMAKVRILKGDVAGARSELARVVAMNGDRREEATRLLAQLR